MIARVLPPGPNATPSDRRSAPLAKSASGDVNSPAVVANRRARPSPAAAASVPLRLNATLVTPTLLASALLSAGIVTIGVSLLGETANRRSLPSLLPAAITLPPGATATLLTTS